MSSLQRAEALEKIKKTQENIAVVIGSVFALTMCVYFFTYAMLVDKGLSAGLWAQGISSCVMLLILFRLKQVSFFIARLWLSRRAELRDTLNGLTAADL